MTFINVSLLVTPAAMSEEQTISTLRFASEAKKIQNHAKVNEVLDNQATISRLKKEMEELKKQMELQKVITGFVYSTVNVTGFVYSRPT